MGKKEFSSSLPCAAGEKCVRTSTTAPEDFASVFIGFYDSEIHSAAETEKLVTDLLSEMYGGDMGRTLQFLLSHVSQAVVRTFAYTYLSPQSLANRASMTVVVRPVAAGERCTLTMGRFAVELRKADGTAAGPVSFSSQVAKVLYIMHLIDRKQKPGLLPPLRLETNEEPFVRLYHAVYDQRDEDVRRRYRQLLYREVDGKVRVGRKGAAISDVRRHLAEAFRWKNESFVPYAMTARSHLAIPADRIVFEGKAKSLLCLRFQ